MDNDVEVIGFRRLIINGYVYVREHGKAGRCYWHCMRNYKGVANCCHARATTSQISDVNEKCIVFRGPNESPHNHPPLREELELVRTKFQEFENKNAALVSAQNDNEEAGKFHFTAEKAFLMNNYDLLGSADQSMDVSIAQKSSKQGISEVGKKIKSSNNIPELDQQSCQSDIVNSSPIARANLKQISNSSPQIQESQVIDALSGQNATVINNLQGSPAMIQDSISDSAEELKFTRDEFIQAVKVFSSFGSTDSKLIQRNESEIMRHVGESSSSLVSNAQASPSSIESSTNAAASDGVSSSSTMTSGPLISQINHNMDLGKKSLQKIDSEDKKTTLLLHDVSSLRATSQKNSKPTISANSTEGIKQETTVIDLSDDADNPTRINGGQTNLSVPSPSLQASGFMSIPAANSGIPLMHGFVTSGYPAGHQFNPAHSMNHGFFFQPVQLQHLNFGNQHPNENLDYMQVPLQNGQGISKGFKTEPGQSPTSQQSSSSGSHFVS
ncbi:hypothetical protein QAD02_006724 [Eretmocerus hayati]|uniref:Uncharacterized protein n=1 Tax=Eretmocerus hayati TaxID=131215 RepID=A0ACC2N210_9HYME|nr:hypothetical protein QAD02_006724 [Eretmocerus hayati]